MQKPSEWESTQAATGDFKSVTPGGHICKIISARVEQTSQGKEVLVIAFDIVEGADKNFYTDLYDKAVITNKDAKWQGTYRQLTQGDSLKFFKGLITAIENSNSGYKWDFNEASLKGKLFGGVFGQEEWVNNKGEVKLSTKCRWIRSVEQVRKGVDVPEIKRVKRDDTAKSMFGGTDEPVNF